VIPPDPARGVFETIRVERGRALYLEDHLARLRNSARELYGAGFELRLPELPDRPCRLRVTVLPSGEVTVELAPLGEPNLVLAPWTVPGGLGAHKWADRRAIDEATQRLGATPLILDEDGSVLEAAWANVWVREGDRLVTPPADGRLLPGVTRARLLRTGPHAAEEPLTLERLEAADVILLTSALRGDIEARLQRPIT
jgi:para-aminobenzoate synthetase / 4-amino-4-deoxychorismate lyase